MKIQYHSLPFVSVVMPIYNRADYLNISLPPLLSQTYPGDHFEIILVDDGSTDNTVERANTLLQAWGGKFRLLSKPNGGPASARNFGIKASSADIIMFIDSDCAAEADWVESIVNVMINRDIAGIGAPIIGHDDENWVSRYMERMKFYRHRIKNGQVDYLITGNVAFLRSALISVSGFEDEPGVWVEDVDLSFKLRDAGYKLGVTEVGVVRHYGAPSSVQSLARNLFRYGKGNYVLSSRWKNRRKPYVEFTRHFAAVILSPYIALSHTQTSGLMEALSFIPLVVIEHMAFCLGMLSAMLSTKNLLSQKQ